MAPLDPAIWWFSTVYGNGLWVAVGANAATTAPSCSAWSIDGQNWTMVPSAGVGLPVGSWNSVTFGNGRFVAVSTANRSAYSTDGKNWNSTVSVNPLPITSEWNAVTYGTYNSQNRFITIGYSGDTTRKTYSSTDGYSWDVINDIPFSSAYNYSSIVCGTNIVVAVGTSDESSSINLDTVGGTWNISSDLPYGFVDYWFRDVIFVNSMFYTCGTTGIYSCPGAVGDSLTWTQLYGIETQSITYGPGKKWCKTYSNTIKYADSPSGPWSDVIGLVAPNANWWFITYDNGMYIALGVGGTVEGNAYSTDGINWGISGKVSFSMTWFFSP
jgi:hypothetical protein